MQTELFGPVKEAATKLAFVDFFNLAAQWNHGKPAEWRWCGFSAIDKPEDYFTVEGAVPIGVITRGNRKGRPKWPKERDKIWMRFSEIEAVKERWERQTGKCAECSGHGKEWAGTSVAEGTTYRTCRKCKGSGAAKTESEITNA